MKNILRGSITAATAMYLWGIVYWWPSLPYKAIDRLDQDDEGEIVRFLQDHLPDSGTYMIPAPHSDPEVRRKLQDIGPGATLHVLNRGAFMETWEMHLRGGVQALLTALLIGYLMSRLLPALSTYRQRVRFVALAGLAAALYNDLAAWIWWNHPWRWHVANAVFDFFSWFLAGLILALFIKPQKRKKFVTRVNLVPP